MTFTVREVTMADDIAAADELRREAWHLTRPSQDLRLNATGYFEPAEAKCVHHYGAFISDELVGSGRVSIHRAPSDLPEAPVYGEAFLQRLRFLIASINRLVVHPDFRRSGIAAQIDAARLARARAEGCTAVVGWWTSKSGAHRLQQLRRYGFMETDAAGVRASSFFEEVLPLYLPLESH